MSRETDREAKELERWVAAYRQLPQAEPAPELDRAVLAMAAQAVKPAIKARRTPWTSLLATAATVTLAVGVAWQLRMAVPRNETETSLQREPAVVAAPAEETPAPHSSTIPADAAAPVPGSAPVLGELAPAASRPPAKEQAKAAAGELEAIAITGSRIDDSRTDEKRRAEDAATRAQASGAGTTAGVIGDNRPADTDRTGTEATTASGAIPELDRASQASGPFPFPDAPRSEETRDERLLEQKQAAETAGDADASAAPARDADRKREAEGFAREAPRRVAPVEATAPLPAPEPPVVFDQPPPMAEPAPAPAPPAPAAPAPPPPPSTIAAPKSVATPAPGYDLQRQEGERRDGGAFHQVPAQPAPGGRATPAGTGLAKPQAAQPPAEQEASDGPRLGAAAKAKPLREWFDDIRRLLREGRRDEAQREFEALRRAWPDAAVPQDLRRLLQPKR